MAIIRKALTFRASSIGDCLMARYILENIHVQYPSAKLGVVVASRSAMIRDLMQDAPWLEVVEANRRDTSSLWRLWRDWRESDLVITQYAGKHGGAFGLGSKLAARILARPGGLVGFRDSSLWNRFLYTKLLPVRRETAVAEHEREALRAAGLLVPVQYPHIIEPNGVDTRKKFAVIKGSYLVVHPFAGNAGRSLSPEKARTLIQELWRVMPAVQVLISGGPGDKSQGLAIANNLQHVSVIAGDATLQEMMGLISGCAGVVSVDTGVAHLTAHLRKPLVVLRTCLGPNWWFPEQYGADAPVWQFSCEHRCTPHRNKDYPDCINELSMAQVAATCAAHVAPMQ